MQIGSFGDVVFEVSSERVLTPDSVTRSRKARFAEHKVLGTKARLEFIAPELTTLSMHVLLHASFGVDPVKEADRLAEMCSSGKVDRLVLSGKNLGTFVLEGIEENLRRSGRDGSIILSDVTLTFKEYL